MQKLFSKILRSFPLLLAFGFIIVNVQSVYAASETVNSVDSYNVIAGQTSPVSGVQVNGTGNDNISVRLFVPSGTLEMTTIAGLTFYTATSNNELRFSGLRSDINTALATLQFTSTSITDVTLNVTIIENGYIYNPENQHVYKVVSNPGNWSTAESNSTAESFQGIPGYLATITSSSENNYITEQFDQDGWIGASDAITEGDWKWETGPEAGTSFWSGDFSGSPVVGQYSNWDSSSEPNDSGGGEDCAQILSGGDGLWNDMPCSFILSNYIVEFGEPGNLPSVEYKNITLNVEAETVNVANCDELFALDDSTSDDVFLNINITADIDCENRDETSLFADYTFNGSVNGNGHLISNVKLTNTVENENIGLFAVTGIASFSNLRLDNIELSGSSYIGSLVGQVNGRINVTNIQATNISITNTDFGDSGGLIGYLSVDEGSSTISNSSATGTINSLNTASNTGGLIGYATAEDGADLNIEQVFANMTITGGGIGDNDVGGLIGELESENGGRSLVQNAYSWSNINTPNAENVGGLIGRIEINDSEISTLIIRNTYAKGSVTGGYDVGGLIGQADAMSGMINIYIIENSFSMADLTATDPSNGSEEGQGGGLIGAVGDLGDTNIIVQSSNNYFDATRTGYTNCNEPLVIPNCSPVNLGNTQPNYFINTNTIEPIASWNFANIWVLRTDSPPIFGSSSSNNQNNNSGSNTPTETLANTGDSTNRILVYATSLLMAGAVISIIAKKSATKLVK